MSNHLAIATVTAVLRDLLQAAMNEILPLVDITTWRPDKETTVHAPTINIYLYQVAPNVALRNVDLPSRGADGRLIQRPRVALDLYYLISFYGDESLLEPQRMMGGAVIALHAFPVITPAQIRATIRSATEGDPGHYLTDSDLASQVEHVAFTPIPMTLEELSKLWSILLQAPYALSASYRASAILIEADLTPIHPLPAHRIQALQSPQVHQPAITSLRAADEPRRQIVYSSVILILGSNLASSSLSVRFDEQDVDPAGVGVTETQIQIPLPPLLRAGVHRVQVIHWQMLDGRLSPIRESNVAPFVLQPTILNFDLSAALTLTLAPAVAPEQRVVLLLNEIGDPAARDPSFYALVRAPEENETIAVRFNLSGVLAGTYAIRVQVDGAESPLMVDNQQQITGPLVQITEGQNG